MSVAAPLTVDQKAAKNAKAFLTGTWVEKAGEKGPTRWLTALSLKS